MQHVSSPRPRTSLVVALVASGAIALVGCTPFGRSSEEDATEEPVEPPEATVTIPPVRLTPFCQAMIDLADRLVDDPPDDVTAEIIATYEAIEPEVPDAIRDDFQAVLADLRGEPAPGPTGGTEPGAPSSSFEPGPPATDETGATLAPGDPFFDEGYQPEDTPALRLNAYVAFECRDVANNPGPPPTQPMSDAPTTEPG